MVEAGTRVGTVAEGLVGRLATPAERNYRTTGQAERSAGGIQDLEFAFNPNGPVIQDSNFSWHHKGW